MLIDPFVIIAQIINFLILVALLKRFLYKPITHAMKARSQRIESQLATAAAKEQDAEAEKELYLRQQQELAATKQSWLEEAKQEVEREKESLTQKARVEVSEMRSQWHANFERDERNLARQIRDKLSTQITLTTRKALRDLANADLETQIVKTFIERLYNLDRSQLEAIRNTSVPNDRPIITIRSSFIIPDKNQESLITALKEQIVQNAEVQFELSEHLICGIELRYEGYKISWNVDSYLTELEFKNNLRDRL